MRTVSHLQLVSWVNRSKEITESRYLTGTYLGGLAHLTMERTQSRNFRLTMGLTRYSSAPRLSPRRVFSVSPMAVRAKAWASEMLNERRGGFKPRPFVR